MVSKIEVLAYYISLGMEIYLIVSASNALGSNSVTLNSIEVSAFGIQLRTLGFAFSVVLLLMDLATLKSYYLEEQRKKEEPEDKSSGFEALKIYCYQYFVTSTIELYLLVSLIIIFGLDVVATNFEPGKVLNVVFLMVDYIMVCFRSTAKLASVSKGEYFEPKSWLRTELTYPFILVIFTLIAVFDMLEGVIMFPFSFFWSLESLLKEKWLPGFLETAEICAPVKNVVDSLT